MAAFLAGRIGFLDIAAIVEEVVARFDPPAPAALEDVFEVDAHARERAKTAMEVLAA